MEETNLENLEQKIDPKDAHDILCDLLLQNPTVVKVGKTEYNITGLCLASRLMISKIFHNIVMIGKSENEKEDDIVLMYKAIVEGTTNFEHVIRIASICINNHKFKPFQPNENEKMIEDTMQLLLYDKNINNENELIKIVEASMKHLIKLESVFLTTLLVQSFANALIQQREVIREQLKSVPEPLKV
jgi:hypothetical protein